MDGLTKPPFLGRLRHERLTSNQMVSILKALPGDTISPSISPRLQWAGAHIPTRSPLYRKESQPSRCNEGDERV